MTVLASWLTLTVVLEISVIVTLGMVALNDWLDGRTQ